MRHLRAQHTGREEGRMWRGGGRAQRPRHGAIARVSPAQRWVAASGRAPESAAAIRFARARQSGAGGPGPRNWEYVAPLRGLAG